MKIAIVDADLIGRKRHRFPNLACEKISGYWKEKGADVHLVMDYDQLNDYDHVFISKVFTDTPIPVCVQESEKIHIGGTGFFFDKAPNLLNEIEHHFPDYQLYDEWIDSEAQKAENQSNIEGTVFKKTSFMAQFKEYTDYSIGFLTRGCFRKCQFCVNQKYDHVFAHSKLDEFFSPDRKKICLLDDNFFGYPRWRSLLEDLIATGKSFKFKQGLDERLLTDEKCKMLFNANYDGDFTFAFDNIEDYELVKSKLMMIRRYTDSLNIKFYVLVGFKSCDEIDIENAFRRLELLMRFQCLPYIMRYQHKNETPWKNSKYRGLYISLARWGNQPSFFKKMSFRQFCEANQAVHTSGVICSTLRAMREFEHDHPDVAKKYFDLNFETFLKGVDNENASRRTTD